MPPPPKKKNQPTTTTTTTSNLLRALLNNRLKDYWHICINIKSINDVIIMAGGKEIRADLEKF
jgi:hypothetical protein